jgi:hypothetical protein
MDDVKPPSPPSTPLTLDHEETTRRYIHSGTILEFRQSSWPPDGATADVSVDVETTPFIPVLGPTVSSQSSRPPPASWSSDAAEITRPERRFPTVPDPTRTFVPYRGTWLGRSVSIAAGIVALGAIVARCPPWGMHGEPATTAAASAPVSAVTDPYEHTEPDPSPSAPVPTEAKPTPVALVAPAANVVPPVAHAESLATAAPVTITASAGVSQRPTATPGALALAHRALASRQYDLAAKYYVAILASTPRDAEAITGLADVARGRGDLAGASQLYSHALGIAPRFLPARIGLADTHWDSGDKARSVAEYRSIVDDNRRVPAYVEQRASAAAPAHEAAP